MKTCYQIIKFLHATDTQINKKYSIFASSLRKCQKCFKWNLQTLITCVFYTKYLCSQFWKVSDKFFAVRWWRREPTRCNNNGFLIIHFSSTCFGQQFCPSSGALECAIQLVVCCTQYVAGRWSGDGVPPLPDHRPATYWVQHTTSCIAQSKVPEDGQNCCSKHVELNWIYQ